MSGAICLAQYIVKLIRNLLLACLALSAGAWAQMSISTAGGQLKYSVTYRGKPVIADAALGLQLTGEVVPGPNVRIAAAREGSVDETYSMPHGKSNPVRNYCRTLALDLDGAAPLTLETRAYNDGVAFRYLLRGASSSALEYPFLVTYTPGRETI
ncbi:MAG: glycoside hydrolase family 97 N-terminal domain-containing protein [Bryobacteraceae bacterium]|jgi:alpha-glucosidase